MPTVTNRKFSVDYRKNEYDCYYGLWQKIRDAVEGQRCIKDDAEGKSRVYLPPLSGHYAADGTTTNLKYDTYLKYAEWYSASGRTVDGLLGLVFRKEPHIEKTSSMDVYFEDLTLDGESAILFSKKVLKEVIMVNRVGILVDIPDNGREGLTKEQIEDLNIRPYARIYKAETVINWKEEIINNRKQTSLVVLDEEADEVCDDYFVDESTKQFRVLKLEPTLGEENILKYVYVQIIFREVSDSNEGKEKSWQEIDRRIPLVNGKPLDYIPFIVVTDDGNNWDINSSMVDGLVDVNISHYRNSANLENGLIWTGNPTPWVAGLVGNNESDTINLGSTECLTLESGGQAGYMEFSGQGLEPLRTTMEDKEKRMALLGAKIIASDKKATETAETATIHKAGEQGVLASVANITSSSMNIVFKIIHEWSNLAGKSTILLNTDYVPIAMAAADMVGLMQMWQSGVISLEVLRWNLKRGERIPNIISNEDMDKQIEDNPPPTNTEEPSVEDEIPSIEEEENEEEDND